MGTKFTVYDHGVSPIKAQGLVEKAHTRQELAAICYVSSFYFFPLPQLLNHLNTGIRDGRHPAVTATLAVVLSGLSSQVFGLEACRENSGCFRMLVIPQQVFLILHQCNRITII